VAGDERPRFSVLLPTRNRADVLTYAIQSVLRQSEQNFEVLIVGDGCTDTTAEVVAAFDDRRIKWFDLPKAPYYGYANRNIALKQARGDFVAFMAHDDLLFPDHLQILATTLERTGTEWAYSRPLWVDLEGNILAYPMNLENESELDVFLNHHNTIPASCVVHRRECFEKYGYWPEDVPEAADWHFWRRIVEGGGRKNFAQCPDPTCLHFVADWRRNHPPKYGGPDQPTVGSFLVRPGQTEQQSLFDAMVSGGDEWVSNMRRSTYRAVDRVAWRAMTEVAPRLAMATQSLEDMSRRLSELEGEKIASEIEKIELTMKLQAVYESRSWRMTSPLRALKRWLRPGT